MSENEVYDFCLGFIELFQDDILKVEGFGLSLLESSYLEGMQPLIKLAEDWLNLSAEARSSLRPLVGAPALLAFRLLFNLGAKAADNMDFETLRMLLTQGIEVRAPFESRTVRLFEDRKLTMHSDGMLGRADLTIR